MNTQILLPYQLLHGIRNFEQKYLIVIKRLTINSTGTQSAQMYFQHCQSHNTYSKKHERNDGPNVFLANILGNQKPWTSVRAIYEGPAQVPEMKI